jgi:Fis family transcriptional regulator
MVATMHYVKPNKNAKKPVLREAVALALSEYFDNLKGEMPENVYNLVLTEVELPLLQAVMKFCNNNQSKAANMLAINRGTFRKKLAFYGML